jgi:polyisoprenoid-binding protein YceI
MDIKMLKKTLLGLALMIGAGLASADQETYKIDDSHSFVNWTIRHVVSKASGTFSDVKGKILIDRSNLANSSIEATISLLSVNSSHAKRDDHIKKEDYLDTKRFAEAQFVSSKITATSATEGIVTGKLTLHGISKEMTFPFKVLGFGADPFGGYRLGIEAHTSIKASDFGFTWPLKPNASVGDDVEITLLLEGVKLNPEPKAIN